MAKPVGDTEIKMASLIICSLVVADCLAESGGTGGRWEIERHEFLHHVHGEDLNTWVVVSITEILEGQKAAAIETLPRMRALRWAIRPVSVQPSWTRALV